MALHIDAVVTNPPWNIGRVMVSYKFIYRALAFLSPHRMLFFVPVSTSDKRMGSSSVHHAYVWREVYSSGRIRKVVDFYRGFLAFRDSTGKALACVDGGVEAVYWDAEYRGPCVSYFYPDRTGQEVFSSPYYFNNSVRLRCGMDVKIARKLLPLLRRGTFMEWSLDSRRREKACPDDWMCIASYAAFQGTHKQMFYSPKSDLDLLVETVSVYRRTTSNHHYLICAVPRGDAGWLCRFLESRVFLYLMTRTQTGRHMDAHNFSLVPWSDSIAEWLSGWDGHDEEALCSMLGLDSADLAHIRRCVPSIVPVPKGRVYLPGQVPGHVVADEEVV